MSDTRIISDGPSTRKPYTVDDAIEDVLSHEADFREALITAKAQARMVEAGVKREVFTGVDDTVYWQHQLNVLKRICDALRSHKPLKVVPDGTT